jgi:uncharacterized protein YggE
MNMRCHYSVTGLSFLLASALACAAPAGPAAPTLEIPRSVTVSGNGEALTVPDRARLSMSVEVTKPELKNAQDEANRAVRDFLAQARALGTHDEDISTAALSIRAEYNYVNNNGTQIRQFAGYHVSRGVELVIRDLDRIGDYLKRATDAGINNLSDPQLESSKADELKRQALANAALDARAKAQVLASTLGARLGPVHTIDAGSQDSAPRPPRPMLAMAKTVADSDNGNSEMGFAAGQLRFGAGVTAVFDLISP